jgi:hypothetical protein
MPPNVGYLADSNQPVPAGESRDNQVSGPQTGSGW